jgi:hypothetical protein
MKPNLAPKFEIPRGLTALIATGAVAMAGCGTSTESVSSQTAPNTGAPVTANGGHNKTPKATTTPEATATPSAVEIHSAGSAYAREADLAENVIVAAPATQTWMEQTGITPDQLKSALESNDAYIVQAPDTHLNGDNHDPMDAKDEVPQGMDLHYEVGTS